MLLVNDSTWVRLSYDSNPVVRAYSYEALYVTNSKFILEVKKRLEKDIATVCFVNNDLQLSFSLGTYVSTLK